MGELCSQARLADPWQANHHREAGPRIGEVFELCLSTIQGCARGNGGVLASRRLRLGIKDPDPPPLFSDDEFETAQLQAVEANIPPVLAAPGAFDEGGALEGPETMRDMVLAPAEPLRQHPRIARALRERREQGKVVAARKEPQNVRPRSPVSVGARDCFNLPGPRDSPRMGEDRPMKRNADGPEAHFGCPQYRETRP